MRAALAVCAALAASAAAGAQAQGFPVKPVRMIVGYPPGGPVDIVTRIVSARMAETLGQSVVVENRPGAGATIATEFVARSAPDGYTVLSAGGGEITIAPSLYPNLAYNVARDFAPIGVAASGALMLVVNPGVPAKSVKDLIALARAKPGRLNFASSGSGSSAHLSGELFRVLAGVDIVHVPYKGAAPALSDLVAGHVDLLFTGISAALPFVKAGKLRGLGVTSATRSAATPDLPPVGDVLPGYDLSTMYALLGPAALPKDMVARLNADLVAAVRHPETRDRLVQAGADPVGGTPEQLAKDIARETARWAKLIKEARIRAE